jgi:serine/threonine-protein kinase 24/25/MST4
MRSDWNFDTIKTVSALGTFRGTINDLSLPPGMVAEDDESFDDVDGQNSIDTGAATKGSDPILVNGLGMNPGASHSTIIVKPSHSPGSGAIQSEETPGG